MGYNGNVVGSSLSADLEDCVRREAVSKSERGDVELRTSAELEREGLTLSHSSHPHDVRLENVDRATLDELAESVEAEC
jgi:hypothetical protein